VNIILVISLFLIPFLIVFYTERNNFLKKLGAILIAYILGVLFSLLPFDTQINYSIKENIAFVAVLLALPLLIISHPISDIKKHLKNIIGNALISVTALLFVIFILFQLFKDKVSSLSDISALLVGLYTGGTPNLASIQAALQIDNNIYLTVHISDILISALFLLLAIFLLKRKNDKLEINLKEKRISLFKQQKEMLPLLLISILLVFVSIAISYLLFPNYLTISVIILLTSFALFLPFVYTKYNKKLALQLGDWLIVVFSFSIASMTNISLLTEDALYTLVFVFFVVFITFCLHLVFAKLFKYPIELTIVTSVSLICSPAFVPLVLAYTNRKDLLVPGISIGVLGYLIGNYLALFVHFLLH
jgi:uncharacterized membrane protein